MQRPHAFKDGSPSKLANVATRPAVSTSAALPFAPEATRQSRCFSLRQHCATRCSHGAADCLGCDGRCPQPSPLTSVYLRSCATAGHTIRTRTLSRVAVAASSVAMDLDIKPEDSWTAAPPPGRQPPQHQRLLQHQQQEENGLDAQPASSFQVATVAPDYDFPMGADHTRGTDPSAPTAAGAVGNNSAGHPTARAGTSIPTSATEADVTFPAFPSHMGGATSSDGTTRPTPSTSAHPGATAAATANTSATSAVDQLVAAAMPSTSDQAGAGLVTSVDTPIVRPGFAFPPAERSTIRESWDSLMRWSKIFQRSRESEPGPLEVTSKVVVFGGGSFGTAMGVALARQKADLKVVLLVRDPVLVTDINVNHCNSKYLQGFELPPNVTATTVAADALRGAQFAVHAVPVQSSRKFLMGIKDLLSPSVPVICVSKGLEASSGNTMSDIIHSALGRRQPAVFLSGPSFAKEVMQNRPTSLVAASRDIELAHTVQALFASPVMRINTTTDEVGVEISGALKNVLAIAAGIVEGLDLGHNAMAALLTQGCAEIRWLAERTGAKPTTVSGLSGLGDIMLTCYGDLSRNRAVGIRLGRGETIEDIIASSSQVAEGVATAGAVVSLARRYRVSLPVLTAVAQVLTSGMTPHEAVYHVMNLPQIDER